MTSDAGEVHVHTLNQLLSKLQREVVQRRFNLSRSAGVKICTPFPLPDPGGLQTMNHFPSQTAVTPHRELQKEALSWMPQ